MPTITPLSDREYLAQLAAARRARGEDPNATYSMPSPASHQLCNQTSFDTDLHTPPEILDMVREVFGGTISLDPASSAAANERVRAETFWTESAYEVVGRMEHDGAPIRRYVDWGALNRSWNAETLWLNAPFGTPDSACKPGCTKVRCRKRGWHTAAPLPGMRHWISHLVGEHEAGRYKEAITITFASLSEGWFQPLAAYPVCQPHKRINYLLPDGTVYRGVTKGSVLTYVGPNVARFAEVFNRLGTVKVPYGYAPITPNPSLPPLGDGPRRPLLVEVNVPTDWEKRLDMQWVVEREVHADRWNWRWPEDGG